ncbi:MAG: biotin synthase BioB [Spirochaetales bacterium]|nr:biotin synthase BioB [Spirochaetales bacterium]
MNGNDKILHVLSDKALTGEPLSQEDIRFVMNVGQEEILSLLQAAYRVRYRYFGNNVRIHVLDNVESGACSEDCAYCGQSAESGNRDAVHPFKEIKAILAEAKQAYDAQAFRHCLVFSGKELGEARIENICRVVREIKERFPMQICVSAGILSEADALKLKQAGVNRYNHNLNTSSRYYGEICTTHLFEDRVRTIKNAKSVGLEICSGVIVGMGETIDDYKLMLDELRGVGADSVPVNFFIPVPGHRVRNFSLPDPVDCLKILCLFRLGLPETEIRASAGREKYLKSLNPFCLYPANSLFTKGYLTVGGESMEQTREMIEEAGFVVERVEY